MEPSTHAASIVKAALGSPKRSRIGKDVEPVHYSHAVVSAASHRRDDTTAAAVPLGGMPIDKLTKPATPPPIEATEVAIDLFTARQTDRIASFRTSQHRRRVGLIVAGQTMNCCVESTAREVAMRDYYLVVAEDCVAVKDMHEHLHVASLETMRTYFGIVTPSIRIIDAWR
jgi:hypothetical protein